MMTRSEFEEVDKKVAKMLKEGWENHRILKAMLKGAMLKEAMLKEAKEKESDR
jgi:hypothetical protein